GRRVLAHFDGDLFGGAGGGVPVAELETAVGQPVPSALLRRLETGGFVRVEDELDEARVRVKTERWLRLADSVDVAAALDDLRGARQQMLLEALADGPLAQAEALQESGASSGTVKSLVQKGLIEAYDVEVERAADEMSAPV